MTSQGHALATIGRAMARVSGGIRSAGIFIWKWSVVYRSGHRAADKTYSSVWSTSIDEGAIRAALHALPPNTTQEELPTEEEHVRRLLREHFPPPKPTVAEKDALQQPGDGDGTLEQMDAQRRRLFEEVPEEAWEHIPTPLRYMLAAMNAHHMEQRLQEMGNETYHPSTGLASINRSSAGVRKTFSMWRNGFAAGVSRWERICVNIFFPVLAFSAVYPDVAAGFLGERSYNQRSIGSRIVTLVQLFFLRTFPFPSFWLLFNWSLERLLGAFVGNSVYALVAIVPAIRVSYHQTWFRTMLLVLSMCWQVGVQFSLTIRDNVARLLTRRQMRAMRRRSKPNDIDWATVDKNIAWELLSLKAYTERQAERDAVPKPWQDVPIKVRTERYIQFTRCFQLGRPANQLVDLLKDDLEGVVNTYEDYYSTALRPSGVESSNKDKGHVEPQLPKFLLVFFDIVIFTYVCYSFYTQPFTFNTVVAYSTVVILKQTIIAFKRYQSIMSARRLFTNMVSINILGMLLVSTPVTVDREILAKDGNFVALTLAMVFATTFLAEPIAPLLLSFTEKVALAPTLVRNKLRQMRQKMHAKNKDKTSDELSEEASG